MQVVVSEEFAPRVRADRFLQGQYTEFSRSEVQKWISSGKILMQEKPIKKNAWLKPGDTLEVTSLPEAPKVHLEPEKIPLDIIYQDDDVVVINKPKDLVVHPGNGVQGGTLAAGLAYHFGELSDLNGEERPGIVHRLDKDTSGLMVVARHNKAHRHLSAQLQDRSLTRIYRAIVWGQVDPSSGVVDRPIGRDVKNRVKMSIRSNGREARTHFEVEKFFEFASLMKLKLETGRTHQIRVHMQHMGYPIVGDALYGGRDKALNRLPPLEKQDGREVLKICKSQALQASEIRFIHPATQEEMHFSVPFAPEIEKAISYLSDRNSDKYANFDSLN